MRQGFFIPKTSISSERLDTMPHCGRCGLSRTCHSPCMLFHGKGRKKILIVGEAPGRNEDIMNEQFVGKAGQRLKYEFDRLGIKMNIDCWKTNAVACRPPENKKPDSKIIAACQPRLFRDIETLKPEHILLFGSVPLESVMKRLWAGDNDFALSRWFGWTIPIRNPNAWVSVHYHPSYLERQSDDLLDRLFRQGLKQALQHHGRPWKAIPKEEEEVELLYKVSDACKWIQSYVRSGCTISFDYETNALKPDYPGTQIVSCSVCVNGMQTAAFPWAGGVVPRMREVFCNSKIRKIGQNIKFEHRWTRIKLGIQIRGWVWDTMLASHVLNQSKHVTSLKFQAFVQFGQPKYDTHIEHLLEPVQDSYLNRIKEIPLRELLLYNGLDSKFTYKLAKLQRKEIQKDETDQQSKIRD